MATSNSDSDPIDYYTKMPHQRWRNGMIVGEAQPPKPITTLDELKEIRDDLVLNLTACTRIIAYLEKQQ